MHSFSIDYLTRKEADNGIGRPARSMNGFCESNSLKDCENNSDRSSDGDQELTHGSSKPPLSYIALISMAILDSADKQSLLGDIYQYVMDKFPYYNNKGKAWRNSIRHNLSLNECFFKSGRSENGRGNFWSIHPACIEDFSKGDFRRRKARRRARNSGLIDVSEMPLSYRSNLGYVLMTPSVVPFSPTKQSVPSSSAVSKYSHPVTPFPSIYQQFPETFNSW